MQKTQLTVYGISGQVQSFVAKVETITVIFVALTQATTTFTKLKQGSATVFKKLKSGSTTFTPMRSK